MIERTTVRLPSELMNRARKKAAAEGRTLTELIEEGVRVVVAKRMGAPAKRKLPRVSSAPGGFFPGVDISNNASLQDIEDAEYIERLNRGFR